MIKSCDCKHEYQDKRYGKGKRLHNPTTNKYAGAQCTVCGKVRPA